jgi:hypothetical protein
MNMKGTKRNWLRIPVVKAGAEYLVMGYIMRRNRLTYQEPLYNEGYDIVCIHPDPRYKSKKKKFVSSLRADEKPIFN